MRAASNSDKKKIKEMDKKMYNDDFLSDDFICDMINKKSKHKIFMNSDKNAFIIIFIMPNKSIYITSLAGSRAGRRELLEDLIKKYENRIIYTHGKEKWDMKLLREFNFQNLGRGNPDDELVSFSEDIRKLWLYKKIIRV